MKQKWILLTLIVESLVAAMLIYGYSAPLDDSAAFGVNCIPFWSITADIWTLLIANAACVWFVIYFLFQKQFKEKSHLPKLLLVLLALSCFAWFFSLRFIDNRYNVSTCTPSDSVTAND
jgi:nitric oxide reductase large subunit